MANENRGFRFFEDMPPWARGATIVALLGGGMAVAYTIYKRNKDKKELDDANQAAIKANQDLNNFAAQGIRPSYPESQYEIWAQGLTTAMDGCGTDENAIYDIFKNMKNEADALKLVSVFGVRSYTPCIASQPLQYIYSKFKTMAFGGGLGTWLRYDLTASEVAKVNEILASKSIAYRF